MDPLETYAVDVTGTIAGAPLFAKSGAVSAAFPGINDNDGVLKFQISLRGDHLRIRTRHIGTDATFPHTLHLRVFTAATGELLVNIVQTIGGPTF